MFGWIKKRILKSIIDDAIKQLPKYKDIAILYVEQHKDEILDKVKEAIKKVIEAEIAKAFNK